MSIFISITSFASETNNSGASMTEQTYPANIAYIKNVNATGTNINDETINGSSKTIPNTDITVDISFDNIIIVKANIDNASIMFTGIPVGRSESGKTVFFEGTSSDLGYEVVNFAYVLDTSKTNMYFKETKAKDYAKSNTMLKLYIKNNLSDSRDYYFIEIFDIELNYSSEYIQSLSINPLLGAWTATQFAPIDEHIGEDANIAVPIASSDTKFWSCTRSYYDMGENQTHTISWRTNVDYSNIIKGQEATQYYRLTVYAKSMVFEVNTDLNSDTMSFLHVNSIQLKQTSVPYTAWKSTSIDGIVQNNGGSGELSANIGVSLGILDLNYSIPISFTNVGIVDINNTYTGYENGVNDQYTRSIEITMDSNYKLTQIGQYFEVVSVLRDYGNTTQNAKAIGAQWYVTIINASQPDILDNRMFRQDVMISVID